MVEEHRHFTRIPFTSSVVLVNTQTGHKSIAQLVDISLKGVLISKPSDWNESDPEQYTLHLQLTGNEAEINLTVKVTRIEKNHIGFITENMDIDTATHLRRLVELNLGNEELLERELSELINANSKD